MPGWEEGRADSVGAVAFTVYCLAAVVMLKKWGAWRGSGAALALWAVVAAIGYALVLS